MAETITLNGYEFKKRSPLASWGLVFLTLGVYYLVWYFKINKEARNYLGDESIRPGIALLAVSLGSLLIIPHYVSLYRTGQRIERMQQKAAAQPPISPALGVLASIVLALHVPYMQENLNKVWDRSLQTTPRTGMSPPPATGEFTA
jgi:hypothetical protein